MIFFLASASLAASAGVIFTGADFAPDACCFTSFFWAAWAF